jgi:hypothetical protein
MFATHCIQSNVKFINFIFLFPSCFAHTHNFFIHKNSHSEIRQKMQFKLHEICIFERNEKRNAMLYDTIFCVRKSTYIYSTTTLLLLMSFINIFIQTRFILLCAWNFFVCTTINNKKIFNLSYGCKLKRKVAFSSISLQ